MSLRKSVCKKCRIRELGKDGWNDLANAWFDPYYNKDGTLYRKGHTVCPYPIINRITESIRNKVLATGSNAERWLMKNWLSIEYGGSVIWRAELPPPPWCPYKKEHKR